MLIFVSFLMMACKDKSLKVNSSTQKEQWLMPSFWLQTYLETDEFPFWFNSHLIHQNAIQKIEITFSHATYDILTDKTVNNSTPYRKLTFEFDKSSGNIHLFTLQEYADLRIIHEKKVRYLWTTRTSPEFQLLEDTNVMNDSIHHLEKFLLTKSTVHYKQFTSTLSKNSLYFIQDKRLLNPISIDTMIAPKPTDWIVFPNLKYPQKIYSVRNVIIENPVKEVVYSSNRQIKSITEKNQSLTTTLHFDYTQNGNIKGILKTLKEASQNLIAQYYTIQLDRQHRPKLIFNTTEEKETKEIITFRYFH